MPIKNDWTSKNNNINLNLNDDNNNKNIIAIIIISLCAIGFTYFLYDYIQEEKRKEYIQTKKEIERYNQEVRAYNEKIKKERNVKNEYYSKKGFSFTIEVDNDSYDDRYNFNTILDNLKEVTSNSDDNSYKIEIIGKISRYGNLFYKIYKKNNNNKYDNDFNNILEELKKIKYRVRNYDTEFKLIIHNNSYDLN
ncbi:hypothetical protein [Arcobacter aquimarinus]|uniref:Uncharacterized protein n=1 Tax=Arcobacter aquimarinus TaxID=1315211 RepID=A0AAE7E1Y3_9BACT|nr:hypothetical protein [Arcobacter aquimarinus]QKE26066.1 hypothetical protein AAQM_1317 [Arcobacter aquimarinus]